MGLFPLKIFRAPTLINEAISYVGNWFSRGSASRPSAPVIIVPDRETGDGSAISHPQRCWQACDEEPSDTLVDAVTQSFNALRQFDPDQIKEASTGSILIDPVLKTLGYWPWLEQCGEDGNIPDYRLSDKVVLEIKRVYTKYDQITGPNNNQRFATIAHQIVTYLYELNFNTIFSIPTAGFGGA